MEKVRQRGSQKIDWKLFVKSEKDKVSIEHIYPQTPTHKIWKQSFKEYKKHTTIFSGNIRQPFTIITKHKFKFAKRLL
jgi:hypothetical protein